MLNVCGSKDRVRGGADESFRLKVRPRSLSRREGRMSIVERFECRHRTSIIFWWWVLSGFVFKFNKPQEQTPDKYLVLTPGCLVVVSLSRLIQPKPSYTLRPSTDLLATSDVSRGPSHPLQDSDDLLRPRPQGMSSFTTVRDPILTSKAPCKFSVKTLVNVDCHFWKKVSVVPVLREKDLPSEYMIIDSVL